MTKTDTTEALKLWEATPCGSGDFLSGIEPGSLSWFDAVAKHRYEVSDAWMNRVIDWHAGQDQRLLEVGHGLGTDLLRFRRNGAQVHGVDIAQSHHNLAKWNFDLHCERGDFKLCSARDIDYPTEFFDVVYSHGVLHHIEDASRAVAEIRRVLKPGGRLILGLYYRFSAFHLYDKVFYEGVLKAGLLRLGYRGLLATIERGADGVNVRPYVTTYSRRGMKRLLKEFTGVTVCVAHLDRVHLPRLGKLFSDDLLSRLEPTIGWYVVADARKGD